MEYLGQSAPLFCFPSSLVYPIVWKQGFKFHKPFYSGNDCFNVFKMVCCFASLGLAPSRWDLVMHKMKQSDELQASLVFAKRLDKAENSCQGYESPQESISRGQCLRCSGWELSPWLLDFPARRSALTVGPRPPIRKERSVLALWLLSHSGQSASRLLLGLPWALPGSVLVPEC